MFGIFGENGDKNSSPARTAENGDILAIHPESEVQAHAHGPSGPAFPGMAPETAGNMVKVKFSNAMVQDGITDIHIILSPDRSSMSGWIRVKGVLVRVEEFIDDLDDENLKWNIWNEGRNDESLSLANGKRLRVSKRTTLEKAGNEVFLRVLPEKIPPVVYSLSDILEPVMSPTSGILLVSGITGSGKSTILASLAQSYLDSDGAHIVSIEDPVEYLLSGTEFGYASQRDVGTDVESFAEGVRQALREDPDVILVGEVRDPDTASAALTAAETGHMVLATVHAPSCFGAIDRYLALLGSEEYNAMRFSHAYLGGIHIETFPPLSSGGGVRRNYEVFFNNDASRTHIRERKTHQLGQARNIVINKTLADCH